mgnify:FL=1
MGAGDLNAATDLTENQQSVNSVRDSPFHIDIVFLNNDL